LSYHHPFFVVLFCFLIVLSLCCIISVLENLLALCDSFSGFDSPPSAPFTPFLLGMKLNFLFFCSLLIFWHPLQFITQMFRPRLTYTPSLQSPSCKIFRYLSFLSEASSPFPLSPSFGNFPQSRVRSECPGCVGPCLWTTPFFRPYHCTSVLACPYPVPGPDDGALLLDGCNDHSPNPGNSEDFSKWAPVFFFPPFLFEEGTGLCLQQSRGLTTFCGVPLFLSKSPFFLLGDSRFYTRSFLFIRLGHLSLIIDRLPPPLVYSPPSFPFFSIEPPFHF